MTQSFWFLTGSHDKNLFNNKTPAVVMPPSSRVLLAVGLLVCCIITVPYVKRFIVHSIETYRAISAETEVILGTFESCDVCYEKGYAIHPACLFCVPQIPPNWTITNACVTNEDDKPEV